MNKKILSIICTLSLIFLASCGNQKIKSNDESTNISETKTDITETKTDINTNSDTESYNNDTEKYIRLVKISIQVNIFLNVHLQNMDLI